MKETPYTTNASQGGQSEVDSVTRTAWLPTPSIDHMAQSINGF